MCHSPNQAGYRATGPSTEDERREQLKDEYRDEPWGYCEACDREFPGPEVRDNECPACGGELS